MNALTMAARMLGNMELTSGQMAQLHALNRKYAQQVYTMLHDSGGGSAPLRRELTEAEEAELNARLRSDILGMLTPEQRRVVPQQ
jgi:Spy/CpxP family protein refolding chaperone